MFCLPLNFFVRAGYRLLQHLNREVFKAPALTGWRRAFFAGNAVRFLKLQELAADSRFTDTQRKYWRELCEQCASGGGKGRSGSP